MSATPRRTVRFSDEQWSAGQASAERFGETVTDLLRRLLDAHLLNHSTGLDGYHVEYRATPKDADTPPVSGITGSYEEVRRLFPAKHWDLEERAVSPYRPAFRRAAE